MTVTLMTYVIGLWLSVQSVIYAARIIKSLGIMNSPEKIIPHGGTHRRIALLIPVFKEAVIIADSVKHFNQLAEQHDLEVFYVTTEKEGPKHENPTYSIIKRLINNRSHLLHYPMQKGAKAAQINYSLDQIELSTEKYDYIGVFDADSRPDPAGIDFVKNDSKASPLVYQMPSRYDKSWSSLRPMAKASAAFQTRWTLCYEIPGWVRWQSALHTGIVMYLVGHGLFIRFNSRLRFPEDTVTEDLALGYRLASTNASVKLVPYWDQCSVPPRMATALVQSSRWYSGEMLSYKIFRNQLTAARLGAVYAAKVLLRYIQLACWLLGPLVVASLLLATLITGDLPGALLLMIGVTLYSFIIYLPMKGVLDIDWRTHALIPLKGLLNCAGPMLAALSLIRARIFHLQIDFVKTERS